MKRPKRPSERPTTHSFAAFLLSAVALVPAAIAQEADSARSPATDRPGALPLDPADSDSGAPPTSAGHPLRLARDALLAAGDPAGALEPAERLVEQSDAPADFDHADDLLRLGVVLTLLEDFDAAERRYFDAIDVIRAVGGELSIALAEPYHALGKHYIRAGQLVEAITALEQAQHVYQRNRGLFDVTQAGVIDDLTTAYLGLGDTATAHRLQTERLGNAIRRYGSNDPRVVPFRYGLARYYEQSRLRGAAREQYELALTALQSQTDADETVTLEPLRRLLSIEIRLRDSDTARARIEDILSRHPDVDPIERARSLVSLGDFALARDQDLQAARALYARADASLEHAPDERDALLGRPQMLDFVAPLTSVDRGASNRPYAWGSIVLGFDVSESGRALGVAIVSAEPAGVVEDAFVRRIREAHFRPRIAEGEPVATTDVRYTHRFRYYVAR